MPPAVLLTATMLAGCVTSGSPPIARTLPPPPDIMQPVAVPDVRAGMDMRASAYDHRAALFSANRRLRASRDWYRGVRADYARPR